jgi:hypothetical protein
VTNAVVFPSPAASSANSTRLAPAAHRRATVEALFAGNDHVARPDHAVLDRLEAIERILEHPRRAAELLGTRAISDAEADDGGLANLPRRIAIAGPGPIGSSRGWMISGPGVA